MGGDMGLIFTRLLVRHLLGPPGLSGPVTSTYLDSWMLHTVLLEGTYNTPPAAHHHPLYPFPPAHPLTPLYVQSMILQ